MKYLTILNQGTYNDSNDRSTSSKCELVVSRITSYLEGQEGVDWLHNEGAGTESLRQQVNEDRRSARAQDRAPIQGGKAGMAAGILAGKGVEWNTNRSVEFVNGHVERLGPAGVTVNLVGHSRGSITCYKIARALRDNQDTRDVPVNIFAIDPVPGNSGVLNEKNWRNIALGGNLKKSFLILAESDRRLPFRPYVDALYSMGMPEHKFDTIPGTHGGINELEGDEKEAAALVLSRAVRFLREVNTPLNDGLANAAVLSQDRMLDRYAKLMQKIKKYKKHGTSVDKYFTGMLRVEGKRHAMVYGPKEQWGMRGAANSGVLEETDELGAQRRREHHHGMKMDKVLARMLPEGEEVHATRPHRFFANLEHQTLFGEKYGPLYALVRSLERSGSDKDRHQKALNYLGGKYVLMTDHEKTYFDGWLAKRGLTPPQ